MNCQHILETFLSRRKVSFRKCTKSWEAKFSGRSGIFFECWKETEHKSFAILHADIITCTSTIYRLQQLEGSFFLRWI